MTIEITDRAIGRIESTMKNQDRCLYLEIKGGGCNGFEYHFSPINLQEVVHDDKKFYFIYKKEKDPLVVINKLSLDYIKGATIDYVDELIGSKFTIVKNPNSTSNCGCGSSFSVF